jgi:hypothetical protein
MFLYGYISLHVFTCFYMFLHVFTCFYMFLHVFTGGFSGQDKLTEAVI